MQICSYFYDFGRFTSLDIPINLIETQVFSIFDIVKVFGYIMCYIGSVTVMVYARMAIKIGVSIVKTRYELNKNKKQYIKSIIENVIVFILFMFLDVVINVLIIALAIPESKITIAVIFIILILFQWFYSGKIIKKLNDKINGPEENEEENRKIQEVLEKLSPEELIVNSKKLAFQAKQVNFLTAILPFVLIILIISVSCYFSYQSGKDSVYDAERAYQIVNIDDDEYIVLEKSNSNYILANKGRADVEYTLCIDTTQQKIIPIENVEYEIKRYNKIVLEDK